MDFTLTQLPVFAECFGFFKMLNTGAMQSPIWLTSYAKGTTIDLSANTFDNGALAGTYIALPAAITRNAFSRTFNPAEQECEVTMQGIWGSHKILIEAMNNNYRVVILWQNIGDVTDNKILMIGEGSPTIFNGASASIVVRGDSRILDRMIPDICIQRACNNVLFDARCGLLWSDHSLITTWGALSPDVESSDYFATILTHPAFGSSGEDNWLNGQVVIGDWGTSKERRAVTSCYRNSITISPSFDREVGNDEAVIVSPGCTKDITYCKSRFNNMMNFMGFPELPYKNPAIMGFL